jgi:C-terminal processing protease CtpA/Prc
MNRTRLALPDSGALHAHKLLVCTLDNDSVVLVNEWTNSAAEAVANFAAEKRLATIVGQKTRGNEL